MPKADPADIAESMGYFVLAREIIAGGDPAKVAALIERRDRTVVFPTVEMAMTARNCLFTLSGNSVSKWARQMWKRRLWAAMTGESV